MENTVNKTTEITDEQAEGVGLALGATLDAVDTGRKAYQLSERIAREKIAREILDFTEDEHYDREIDKVISSWVWDKLERLIPQHKVQAMIRDSICMWAGERLREYLKTQDDPEVEALLASGLIGSPDAVEKPAALVDLAKKILAKKIVQTLREARREQVDGNKTPRV